GAATAGATATRATAGVAATTATAARWRHGRGFFFSSRRRHTSSVSAFLLNRSSDLREISMKDVFRSGDSSKKFKIAEGQWYRYAPSYVSPAYHLLEGFPFIQEPPSGDLQERVLIRHHDYDQCFQSVQLL